MNCLLVSDAESQKAAASLHVNRGSLRDPKEINGLAHFCEHMLFLGTKKFPEENHYSKFISSHGGSKNAATGEDYTYYYFDIKNDHFDEALDIFSQFFKEPLFTESATEREMNAVDSEFTKNRSREARRLIQIEKSIITKPGCVLNRFSTGNLATLNVPNIREHLLKFYAENYSSNVMSLSLVGNHSLDALESFATNHFSSIEDKNLDPIDYSNEEIFTHENGLGHFVYIVPQKNNRNLKIVWPGLKEHKSHWRSKPFVYLSGVIGHEGKNSLLSELIK